MLQTLKDKTLEHSSKVISTPGRKTYVMKTMTTIKSTIDVIDSNIPIIYTPNTQVNAR